MAALGSLPQETLKLIIDVLQCEHDSLVVPLAQTYNKVICTARQDCLMYRRTIPTQELAVRGQFFEKRRPGVVTIYPNELDVSFLGLKGDLERLDDLAWYSEFCLDYWSDDDDDDDDVNYPGDECGWTRKSSARVKRWHEHYRCTIGDLITQSEVVGCKLSNSFIKFYKRLLFHENSFPILNEWRLPNKFFVHKVYPRKDVTGHYVQFFISVHGEAVFCLYLEPGPAKGNAVILTTGCASHGKQNRGTDDFEGEYDENDSPMANCGAAKKLLEIADSRGYTPMACHELKCYMNLIATDFEAGLAATMFD